MRGKAFSLIELLVVIAIVAILASVAQPAYKEYIYKSKVISVVPVVDMVLDKSKEYFSINGGFPSTADQIGLSSTPGSIYIDNPGDINPYLTSLRVGLQDTPQCTACDGSFRINGVFDLAALGIDGENGIFQCYYFHQNGTVRGNCSYSIEIDPGVYKVTDYLPGWYTCLDSDCTTSFYHAHKDGYQGNPGFTSCNCNY